MGKTSNASKTKYNSKAYDQVKIYVVKGQREIVRKAATAVGQSVNAYILQAVRERMERDGFQMQEPEESEEDPQ